MLDITVKTLDGKNRSFSVPDDILVKDFKARIAPSVEIPAETQRLIFQGRVLQDDKRLNEYDVNGKTLHIVQRPPPLAPSTSTSGRASATPTTSANGGRRTVSGQVPNSGHVMVGSHDAIDAVHIQNAVQQALSASGMMGQGQNVVVQTRGDGSSVDVHINLGMAVVESESQHRIDQARRMMAGVTRIIDRIERPNGDDADTVPMDVSSNDNRPTTSTEATAGSPMDTSTASPPVGSTDASRAEPAAPPQPEGTTGARNNDAPGANGRVGTVNPATSALGELLGEVFEVNRRLQPSLERYRDLLQRDPEFTTEEATGRQTECDRVAEAIHYLSHAYHNISDVMINLNQAPPRHLRAVPAPMMQPGFLMQHMPPHAHVNLLHPPTSASESTVPPSTASGSVSVDSSIDSTSETTRPNTPGPGSLPPGALPPGAPGSDQPYVFMEVGPQSVSISSVTSHVVTEGGTEPTTQTDNSNTTTNASTGEATNAGQHANTTGPTPPGQPQARATPPGPPGGIHMAGMPPFMPPNLLQNIIHMATNAAMQNQTGQHVLIVTEMGETPSTATSSTSASSSSSSSTTGRQPGGATPPTSSSSTTAPPPSSGATTVTGSADQPRTATVLIPGPPGGGRGAMFRAPPGAELVEPVDPHLQCHSRFFLGRRQPDNGGMSNLFNSVLSQHQHAHAHAMAHQHHHHHHHHPPQQRPAGTAPQTRPQQARPQQAAHTHPAAGVHLPFATILQHVARQPVPGSGPPRMSGVAGSGARPIRVQLQHIQHRVNPTNQNSTPPSRPAAPQQPVGTGRGNAGNAGNPGMSNEIFGRLVHGIGSHLSQAASGEQSTETISAFLQGLGQGYDVSPGEGILSDLFMLVSEHVTFIHLMSVFFGNPQPLQSLRAPLQQFINEHVLRGDQPTVANIDTAVARLLDDMREDITATSTDVAARDDIDFNRTLTRFIREQLTITIRMIVNVPADDEHFGRDLCERLRRVIHEFIVLSQYCLEGGTEAVERMIQTRLEIISSDASPMIQQWMTGMALQQLRQILPTITIGPDDILHYVVRRGENGDSSDSASNTTQHNIAQQAEMETEPRAADGSTASVPEEDVDEEEEEEIRPPKPNIPAEVLDGLSPAPTKDEGDDIAVVLGSEDWHRAVPSEWVPVITRDVHRQSRSRHTTNNQTGFSEAYIAGMPAKRRKMMSPEGGEVTNSTSNTSSQS